MVAFEETFSSEIILLANILKSKCGIHSETAWTGGIPTFKSQFLTASSEMSHGISTYFPVTGTQP